MKEQDTSTPAIETRAVQRRRQTRGLVARAMLFIAGVMLVDGLFGQHGLTETIRARREYTRAAGDLARLLSDNDRLRDEIQRLRDDPATIESVARDRLGMARPGEIVVTIHDEK